MDDTREIALRSESRYAHVLTRAESLYAWMCSCGRFFAVPEATNEASALLCMETSVAGTAFVMEIRDHIIGTTTVYIVAPKDDAISQALGRALVTAVIQDAVAAEDVIPGTADQSLQRAPRWRGTR